MTLTAQADREELAHRLFVIDDEDLAHNRPGPTPSLLHARRAVNGSAMLCGVDSRATRGSIDRGLALGAVVLALYLPLAPATFVTGDNAEFATLGALGGAAHPSGYPAYVLWLRLWSWLPGSPAYSAALATALLGAAAVTVMYNACRAWGAGAIAATIAAAIAATGPIVLRVHTAAEVFAMNDLAVAAVLWLAARNGPLAGTRRLALRCARVSGGPRPRESHDVCADRAGGRARDRARRSRGAAQAAGGGGDVAIAGIAIGLAPYAYLIAPPTSAASWGRIDTLRRRDGDGAASRVRRSGRVPGDRRSGAGLDEPRCSLLETLGRTWLWVPAIAGARGARGADRGAAEHRRRVARGAGSMLLASFVLAGPVLVARFNVEPVGVGRYLVMRFHVLPALLLAIPIAAFDQLAALVPGLPAAAMHRSRSVPWW